MRDWPLTRAERTQERFGLPFFHLVMRLGILVGNTYTRLCPVYVVKTATLIPISRVIHPWNYQSLVVVRLMRFCTAVRRKHPLGMASAEHLFCRDGQILDAHPHGVIDGVGNGGGP